MKIYKPLAFGLLLTTVACDSTQDASEAPRAELAVEINSNAPTEVTTDLGYNVEVNEVRIAIKDLQFTVSGETHTASLLQKVSDFVFPVAYAHPGHYEGGEITGELKGSFIVDWFDDSSTSLGAGTLIGGEYTAANLFLDRGTEVNGLDATDPLIGHTAIISGTATKAGESVDFTFTVDSPEDLQIVGVPFEVEIDSNSNGTIGLQFVVQNPINEDVDTVFDNIDFISLDSDNDGELLLEPPAEDAEVDDTVRAYNIFKHKFERHDHFFLTYSE